MTNPFDPLNVGGLCGQSIMRYVTLALPVDTVRKFLPVGLELGSQRMTPKGTHPVLLGFHDIFKLRTTLPTLLPSLTYHEHSVGIPWCYATLGDAELDSPGPYYFMPTLLLDSALATLGGIVFWGYPKRPARVSIASDTYVVSGNNGNAVVSMSWDVAGDFKSWDGYPKFALHKIAQSQPLVGMMPLSVGPFLTVADFPKNWEVAKVRPLETVTEIESDYVIGLESGRYPAKGKSPGIDAEIVGSYELRTPWTMSAPYPPMKLPHPIV